VLSDKEKRQQYDQFGQTFEQAQSAGGTSGFSGFRDFSGFAEGFDFNFGSRSSGHSGFDDIFGEIFDRAGFGGGSHRSRSGSRGRDIQVDLEIDFSEMAKGTEKEIRLYKNVKCDTCGGTGAEPGHDLKTCKTCNGAGEIATVRKTILGNFQQVQVCPECKGEGSIPEKKCHNCGGDGRINDYDTIKLKVPAGIGNGQTIRLEGMGDSASRGGEPGDLYVTVHVQSDKRFVRDGADIRSEINISFPNAALGSKIEIDTLEGKTTLKIPSGTQSGEIFRLKGKGLKRINHFGHGDQYVKVNVKTPTKLSHEEKDLLEQLKDLE
jgi:molecular chaperone DnaJ